MPSDQPPVRVSRGRGLRVMTLRGVPVFVSPFSVLFALLVAQPAVTLAEQRLGTLEGGRLYSLVALVAVAFLASLVCHELGHALVAQRLGFDVSAITIFGFAGLTEYRPDPQAPGAAFLVSVSGPVVNLVLGGVAAGAYAVVPPNTLGGTILLWLAYVNLILGVFNLAPGLPLDGGHVLQAGIWKATGNRLTATRAAAYAGLGLAVLLGVYALAIQARVATTLTLVTAALIGVGAYQTLRAAEVRSRLPGLTAGSLARRTLPVDGAVPLAEALRRAQSQGATAVVAVDGRGQPVALMSGAAADSTPVERRPWVSLSAVARPIEDGMRLPADLGGAELVRRVEEFPASEYLVVGPDGQPVGVLSSVDLVARLNPQAAGRPVARR